MALSLSKPSAGAVGWSAGVNQNWTDIEDYVNLRRLPKGYVEGLGLSWSSTTAILVGAGSCRDKADAQDLTLASEQTVSITSTGALGLGVKTLSATVSKNAGTNSTATASASVVSELGTRALTGTITTSGGAVTGSGTRFTSELAVGDLIGTTSTYGFGRVVQIYSDISLLIVNLPGGNAPAGTSASVIEGCVLRFDWTTPDTRLVSSITANGLTIVGHSNWTTTDAQSGKALVASVEIADNWYAVWLAKGGSGTTALLSTQRTTPYLPSGYDQAWRRIGWVRNDNAANLGRFLQRGTGLTRRYQVDISGNLVRFLSSGSATTFTDVSVDPYAPPSAHLLSINIRNYNPSAACTISVRPRSAAGVSGQVASLYGIAISGWDTTTAGDVLCDGAQAIQYSLNGSAGSPAHLELSAYTEEL